MLMSANLAGAPVSDHSLFACDPAPRASTAPHPGHFATLNAQIASFFAVIHGAGQGSAIALANAPEAAVEQGSGVLFGFADQGVVRTCGRLASGRGRCVFGHLGFGPAPGLF